MSAAVVQPGFDGTFMVLGIGRGRDTEDPVLFIDRKISPMIYDFTAASEFDDRTRACISR